jgi:hypothetical protein
MGNYKASALKQIAYLKSKINNKSREVIGD